MIDALASEPQYAHHLIPIWEALVSRGTFWVADDRMLAYLHGRGIEAERVSGGLPRPVLVASSLDHAKARRRKAPGIAYMEHGCGQSYPGDRRTAQHGSYAGGRGKEDVAMVLAPNEVAAERWRARYPGKPVHVIGATRVLPPPSGPPCLALAFHWDGGIHEQRNAFAHYRSALPSLAKALPIIGHAHPRFAAVAGRAFERAGIRFVGDIEDVARQATVYAVDNSSTLWEMGLTRPVLALNAPWYRRPVNHGLRFWSHVPVMVDGPDELLSMARTILGDERPGMRDARLDICRDVIPRLDGASEAARLLIAWISGRG